MQATLDGGDGDLEDLGDFVIGTALELAQDKRGALFGRQPEDRHFQGGKRIFRFGCPLRTGRLSFMSVTQRFLGAASLEVVQATVRHDPVEPGGERACSAEHRQSLPGLDKRLLSRVLRLVRVAQQAHSYAVDTALVAANEHLERSQVADLSGTDELDVVCLKNHRAVPTTPICAGVTREGRLLRRFSLRGTERNPLVEADTPLASTAGAEPRGDRMRRHGNRARLYTWAVFLVAFLVVLIALILSNTRHVKVSWVVGSTKASLVWIMLAAAVLGWLAGIATSVLFRRRTRAPR